MSITIKVGATFSAPTGGTDMVFSAADVVRVADGMVQLANTANANFRETEYMLFRVTPPSLQNGNFSKTLRKASVYVPRDYDDLYVRNRVSVEADVHPSMSDSDKTLIFDAAQQLLDDQREFFMTGNKPS